MNWQSIATTKRIIGLFIFYALASFLGVLDAVENPSTGNSEVLAWTDCLQLGLKFNPDVQNTLLRVQQVEGELISRQANFLPHVAAGGNTTSPSITIGFEVPIYTAARKPTLEAFPYARQAAWANAKLAVMEMAYQLRVSYVEAYYDQELVPISLQELDLLDNRLKRAPSLFQAGKMSEADLESLKVRKALAESKVESAKNRAETSRLRMLQITGLSPSDPRLKGQLITDFKDYVTQESDQDKLVSAALDQRQDLQILMNLKKVYESVVLVDAANLYPEVGVGNSFSNTFQPPNIVSPLYHDLAPRTYNQNFDQQNFRQGNDSFQMVANWRLYDGGATEGSVIQSQTDVIKQDILTQQIRDQIPRQVALALNVINSTGKVINDLQINGNAEKNLQAMQHAYEQGVVSQVEVLDAQDEFVLYKENLLRLESGHDQALSALDRIVGQTFRVNATIP